MRAGFLIDATVVALAVFGGAEMWEPTRRSAPLEDADDVVKAAAAITAMRTNNVAERVMPSLPNAPEFDRSASGTVRPVERMESFSGAVSVMGQTILFHPDSTE